MILGNFLKKKIIKAKLKGAFTSQKFEKNNQSSSHISIKSDA